MKQIKIPLVEVVKNITGTTPNFPKYTTQILNLANQNAGGTRPRVVGQLSEMINVVPVKSYEGWKKWYSDNHSEKVKIAISKVRVMINNMKIAIESIDDEMIKDWVEDLMYTKTSEGFIFQEFILKHLSKKMNLDYRRSNPMEESKGIDGFIGDIPVSIKPTTYQDKSVFLHEKIEVKMIYYEKKGIYLVIFTDLI